MTLLWAFVRLGLGAALLLTGLRAAARVPEETAPATAREQQVFDEYIRRMQDNLFRVPLAVTEVLKSYTDRRGRGLELPPIDCRGYPGRKVDRLTVRITTGLRHWQPAYVHRKLSDRTQALYSWQVETEVQGKEKRAEASNFIMFDLHSFEQAEKEFGTFGVLTNLSSVYHELLHGQLQINAILSDKSWQARACACDFPTEESDADHRFIPALEKSFLVSLAKVNGFAIYEADGVYAADEEGNFSIIVRDDLLRAKLVNSRRATNSWRWITWDPVNVTRVDVSIEATPRGRYSNDIILRGKLEDPQKPGRFSLYVDPPAVLFLQHYTIEPKRRDAGR
jgi:hypothetical protein